MRLSAIEIFGFKSFPHRTRVDLLPGITAVVGPNGCGKSNLVDAFRWALGEQSAKSLRGDVMEDLIFNGTADTPPLSVAEVSLTFYDCRDTLPLDADELVVTRRMYRSGESHYFINNRPVRLKDIRDLFADTGLGKASYAVIEQGMVEALVRAKPEERREIFEEAAGIRGYRAKRAEALKKLEDVQANVARVDDLLAEYERQARALKRQANAARRHQALADRLRHLEVALALLQYREIKSRLREAALKRDEAAAAYREARDALTRAEALVSQLAADVSAAELAAEEKEKELLALQRELKEAEAEELVAHERARALADEIAALESRREDLQVVVAAALAEERRLISEYEGLSSHIAALERDLAGGAADEEALAAGVSAAEAAFASARDEHLRRLEERTAIANRHATARASREALARELARLREEESRVAERLAASANELNNAKLKVTELEAAVAGNRRLLAQTEDAATAARAELEDLSRAAAEAERHYEALRSRLAALQELAARGELYGEAAAALLKGGLPAGIVGAVAESLTVVEGYEAAVERALGLAARALAADGTSAAFACGRGLVPAAAGKAAFLIMGRGRPTSPDLPVVAGVRGWAADFVLGEGAVADAARSVLAGVAVVADLAALEELVALYPNLPAVTLAGDYWDGRAILLAGAPGESAATVFGRRREIQELGQEVTASRAVRDGCLAARAAAEEEARALVNRAEGLRQRLVVLQNELATAVAAVNSTEKGCSDLAAKRALLVRETAEAERSLAAAFKLEEELAASLDAADAAVREWAIRVNELSDAVAEARARVTERRGTTAATREELARLRENLRSVAEAREKTVAARAEGEAKLARLDAERAEKQEALSAWEEKVAALAAEVARKGVAFTRADEVLQEARFNLHNLQGQRREAEDARIRAAADAEALAEALKDYEVAVTSVAGEAKALEEAVAAKFGVRLDALDEKEYALESHLEAAVAERDDLAKRLSKMGEINYLAAREYEELAAKIATLEAQRDDLVQARANLDESIARIDAQSREAFLATFERVRVEFQQTFTAAFGGGQADLKLGAGADPLEAGVYIYAQPPGKKMENLNLLSGGEKALTAIALIFALFNVRPAPFAVLDEVDAPLDDNNINRFLSLLGQYRGRVQFMVITHARRTMEEADAIFGVTMERKGVSKVLSLKLEEVPREYMAAPQPARVS